MEHVFADAIAIIEHAERSYEIMLLQEEIERKRVQADILHDIASRLEAEAQADQDRLKVLFATVDYGRLGDAKNAA